MSSSTQAGFSRSPTCSDSGRAFLACVSADALPLRLSLAVAVAVAHSCRSCTAVASPSPLSGEAPLRLWLPLTVGVGHSWRTATPSGVPQPLPFLPCAFSAAWRASKVSRLSVSLARLASGVGQS